MEQQSLTSERWRRMKEIFQAAVELPPDKREVYLAGACAGDPALLTEVESLIAAHEQPGRFLETPAFDLAAESSLERREESIVGRSLSQYRILSLIGRGGMGEVYLALDTQLGRQLALKLLPARFTRDEARLRRFVREAKTASSLNHPNIITIYEIGEAEAHVVLAHIKLHDWDWSGAEEEFKRAIALNPGYASAYLYYAEYLTAVGQADEAVAQMRRALELDPLSPIVNQTAGRTLYYGRRYDEAVEQLNKALELNPHFHSAHFRLGLSYAQQGRYDQAIVELKQVRLLDGNPDSRRTWTWGGFMSSRGDMKTPSPSLSRRGTSPATALKL